MERETDNVFDLNEIIRLKRLNAAKELAFSVYQDFVLETVNIIYRLESTPCSVSPDGIEIFHIGEPYKVDGIRHDPAHCAILTGSGLIKDACAEHDFVHDSEAMHQMPDFRIAEFPDVNQLRIIVKVAHEQHDRRVPVEILAAVRACSIKQNRYYLMPSREEIMYATGLLDDTGEVADT